jgi:acyl-CoA thioesterase-1
MKTNRTLALLAALAFTVLSHAAENPATNTNFTRVACVGDSITQGVGVKDQQKDSYPAQMAGLLGKNWEVKNFGVSGMTMMNKGDRPYQQRPEYKAALDSKPDVVVIALGTNDSKPQNIDTHPDDFLPSYRAMVNRFREVNPRIKIYVCLPVPAFPENWGIRETVISGKIIPQIRQLAQEENLFIIDLHSALDGKSEFFPDKVHPNEGGAALMAKAVAAAISNDLSKGN